MEAIGDLLVAESKGDLFEDLDLAVGQVRVFAMLGGHYELVTPGAQFGFAAGAPAWGVHLAEHAAGLEEVGDRLRGLVRGLARQHQGSSCPPTHVRLGEQGGGLAEGRGLGGR